MLRNATIALVVLPLALLVACSPEEEEVVERWEALAELLAEHSDDCPELAQQLDDFREDHGAYFSSDKKSLYEAIEADPELRLRMERAFARLETEDFACQGDARVQDAARKLFGELVPLPNGE